MKVQHTNDPFTYKSMDSDELRKNFLVESLFDKNKVNLVYTDTDRAIIGSAVPVKKELQLLSSKKEMSSDYFMERREAGIINIGGKGSVTADGKKYDLSAKDFIYIGRGIKDVKFKSSSSENPAKFYLISYPAHTSYPVTLVKAKDADKVNLGSDENANKRILCKYIHPKRVKSCQLVMGFTELEKGSIWNTFPPHTHIRRSEIYMYFDMDKDSMVFHFMGVENETRHLVIRNEEAVISPSFSIHCGAGTSNYSFVWAMGGENQDFDDMDFTNLNFLK